MGTVKPFLLDGVAYNVIVTKLTRKFSVQDTAKTGRVQSGDMYRDIIGTFYNYSMTVEQMGTDAAALDAFWEAIAKPVDSHVCVFPYGQTTLTQRMYITSGEQDLVRIAPERTDWGVLNVSFIAMSPRVVP